MVSTKSFLLHNLKTLPIVLIVFTIFAVGLTNTQTADALSGVAGEIKFDLQRGETDIQTWEIINTGDEKIWVEFFTSGDGGEFILFEKILAIEPHRTSVHEFIVTIPNDHKDNITYKPTMHALKRGDPVADGTAGATISFNTQLLKTMVINIGDNPIYTPPVEEVKIEIPPPAYIPEKEAAKEAKETLQEKLDRINKANEANTVDDVWEETFEEEAVPELAVDDSYIEEPIADPEPITQEEKVECDFIAWLLSLFGIGTCE